MSIRAHLAVAAALALILTVGISAISSDAFGAMLRIEIRIYDPAHVVTTEVTAAEVVPSSARAGRLPGGAPYLRVGLTKLGRAHLHSLTRALARRGARLHRPLPVVVAINGRDVLEESIDYKSFPNGMTGGSGLQVTGLSFETASRIAALIRQG